MYGPLYDRFADWLEDAGERAFYTSMGWLNTLMIPELARLRDRRDRVLIMQVASLDRPQPRWLGWIVIGFFIVFLLLGMYLGWRAAAFILPMGRYTALKLVIEVGGGILGVVAYLFVVSLLTLNRTRHAVYRALANLDEAICPTCGYDLKGHLPEVTEHDIRCPECGKVVPRLTPRDESDAS